MIREFLKLTGPDGEPTLIPIDRMMQVLGKAWAPNCRSIIIVSNGGTYWVDINVRETVDEIVNAPRVRMES